MKKFISLLFICFFTTVFTTIVVAQETKKVLIEDFIKEHNSFEVQDDGEVRPINDAEINKKIKFFVEEKYSNVEFTRNIIWDSYETFLSPYDSYHYHTFFVQVKAVDIDRLKYLEVIYNPETLKVTSNFEWNEEEEEFLEVEEETEGDENL